MLTEINIKDLGVIADSTVSLSPGFTAITGETGAGKTMIVTALGLLMGERSDTGFVRDGAQRALVTGIIETAKPAALDIVADLGGELDEGELLIKRVVNTDTPSRAEVGGAKCRVRSLSLLAQELFCVHGQNEQLRLRSQHEQRDTLDRFAGDTAGEALKKYRDIYSRRLAVARECEQITANRQERQRRAAQLRLVVEEINRVDPQPAETDALLAAIERLNNAEALRYSLATAVNALSAGDGDGLQTDVQSMIRAAAAALDEAAGVAGEFAERAEQLQEIAAQLQEITADLLRGSDEIDGSSTAELEQAQQRLAALKRLERSYGPTLSDVLDYRDSAAAQLAELEDDDERIVSLTAELADLQREQTSAADQLTAVRKAAAAELAAQMTAELAALALPDSELLVQIEPQEPAITGADEVSFMLIPYPNATPRPLAKSASGGELSRIMLALEVVLAGTDPVPTFVFDEVDAGIGGSAAIEVGRRLARLAQTSQVIVVTHLAQVAAFADNHLRIKKDAAGAFTESSCEQLDESARLSEIARLLSGLSDSASALEHAAELLALGQNMRG